MVMPVLGDSGRDDLWLVLPHLGAGGAQKVALIAARYFAAQGLKVKLVTLIPGHPVAHSLPDGIPCWNWEHRSIAPGGPALVVLPWPNSTS